jgi:hypothetical protein
MTAPAATGGARAHRGQRVAAQAPKVVARACGRAGPPQDWRAPLGARRLWARGAFGREAPLGARRLAAQAAWKGAGEARGETDAGHAQRALPLRRDAALERAPQPRAAAARCA